MTDEVVEQGDADVAKMVHACQEFLMPPQEWKSLPGYPDSLALSVLDAIWSINVRYQVTRGVIERYKMRRWQGSPDEDGLPELLTFYERIGGIDAFIDEVGTRNRVSTQPHAMRKGAAVHQAATALHDFGVDTAEQFRIADRSDLGNQLKEVWLAIPGQRSGISWRYLRMLVGLPDVKPDRMILRFIASALRLDEASISADRAVTLVQATAAHFDVDQRALDHEIWEYQSGKRAGHDPASERYIVANLAHSFIGAAFPSLVRDHVIPPPTHFPFIDLARDYFGDDVSGTELSELEAMLDVTYPERFADPLNRQHPEFSSEYIFSFLEGCVARCAKASDDVFEADTPPVQQSVDELLTVLDASEYTMSYCRATSQFAPAGSEPVRIGDITIYPDLGEPDNLMRRAVSLIPSGPSALNREIPRFHDPPCSLVATSKTTGDDDVYGVASELSAAVDRFLLLARLLYAGTHQSCWQLMGASTLISRISPMYQRFEKTFIRDSRMQRVVQLDDTDAAAFNALGGFLDSAVIKREGMVATSFDVALINYNRSHELGDDFERIVDLATALEAILTGSEKDTEAVGHRLRTRAAALLWTDGDPGSAIFRDVGTLYGLRSKLVHGGQIKDSDLRKSVYSLSTVSESSPYGVALAFAVDRLRDIVRRLFLARLCLASGDQPLWPFEGTTAVDAALSDDSSRALWRKTWRDILASLGAGSAADPAEPAADPLRERRARRTIRP